MDRYRVWARALAFECIRNNSPLETIHAGIWPSSIAGDYSDVTVVSPCGETPWVKLGRISDTEMRELMLAIEKNLERLLRRLDSCSDDKDLLDAMGARYFGSGGVSWDRPEL